MKKTNRLFALILAVVMIASLAACSGKLAAPKNAPDANAAVEPTAAELSNKIDLATTEFDNPRPFSEGLAWVTYMDRSTLIDREGNIIYQGDKKYIFYSSVSDGACYFAEGDSFTIIDKDGKVLYQSADGEKLLACGDGKYFVYRLVTGFDKQEESVGIIDKNGNESAPFCDANELSCDLGEWRYLGDGFFFDGSEHTNCVFDSTNSKLMNTEKNPKDAEKLYINIPFEAESENGKIWLHTDKGLMIFDLKTWEAVKEIESSKETTLEIEVACDIFGKTGKVDDAYYDLNGEKIADVSLYPDKVEGRCEFTESGYAYLFLNDQNCHYITGVNKNGEQQFEPLATGGVKAAVNGDYFAIGNGDQNYVVIRDYTGEEKFRVEGVTSVYALGDDYIISGTEYHGKYYFFQ